MTRGINRYKGLSMALTEINEKYTPIEDLDALVQWAENSPELSNGALEKKLRFLLKFLPGFFLPAHKNGIVKNAVLCGCVHIPRRVAAHKDMILLITGL